MHALFAIILAVASLRIVSGLSSLVVSAGDGGFVMATSTDDNVLVVKVSQSDVVEWAKTFASAPPLVRFLIRASDGGFILGGGYGDALAIKISAAGTVEWGKVLGTVNGEEYIVDAAATSDGGCVAVASTWTPGSPGSVISVLLVRVNSVGSVIWSKTFSHAAAHQLGAGIAQSLDGGFLITGHFNLADPYQAGLLKVSSQGALEWTRHYIGGVGISSLWLDTQSVESTRDGGFIVGGYTNWGMGVILMRLSSVGSMIWAKGFNIGTYVSHIVVLPSIEGFAAGGAVDRGSPQESWVAKFSDMGEIEWGKRFGQSLQLNPYIVAVRANLYTVVTASHKYAADILMHLTVAGEVTVVSPCLLSVVDGDKSSYDIDVSSPAHAFAESSFALGKDDALSFSPSDAVLDPLCTATPSWSRSPTPTALVTLTRSMTATGSVTSMTPDYTPTPSRTQSFTAIGSASPSPSPSGSITASASATPSASWSGSMSPTLTFSASWSRSHTDSVSATQTLTTPVTLTHSVSCSDSASPTLTPSESRSATASGSGTVTATATNSATQSATPSASLTTSVSWTSSASPTLTRSVSFSGSASPTLTPSESRSATASGSGTVTATATNSATQSATPSASLTTSVSWTSSASPTLTRSVSFSGSASPTLTRSVSFSGSASPTLTRSVSFSGSASPTLTRSVSFSGSATPSASASRTDSISDTDSFTQPATITVLTETVVRSSSPLWSAFPTPTDDYASAVESSSNHIPLLIGTIGVTAAIVVPFAPFIPPALGIAIVSSLVFLAGAFACLDPEDYELLNRFEDFLEPFYILEDPFGNALALVVIASLVIGLILGCFCLVAYLARKKGLAVRASRAVCRRYFASLFDMSSLFVYLAVISVGEDPWTVSRVLALLFLCPVIVSMVPTVFLLLMRYHNRRPDAKVFKWVADFAAEHVPRSFATASYFMQYILVLLVSALIAIPIHLTNACDAVWGFVLGLCVVALVNLSMPLLKSPKSAASSGWRSHISRIFSEHLVTAGFVMMWTCQAIICGIVLSNKGKGMTVMTYLVICGDGLLFLTVLGVGMFLWIVNWRPKKEELVEEAESGASVSEACCTSDDTGVAPCGSAVDVGPTIQPLDEEAVVAPYMQQLQPNGTSFRSDGDAAVPPTVWDALHSNPGSTWASSLFSKGSQNSNNRRRSFTVPIAPILDNEDGPGVVHPELDEKSLVAAYMERFHLADTSFRSGDGADAMSIGVRNALHSNPASRRGSKTWTSSLFTKESLGGSRSLRGSPTLPGRGGKPDSKRLSFHFPIDVTVGDDRMHSPAVDEIDGARAGGAGTTVFSNPPIFPMFPELEAVEAAAIAPELDEALGTETPETNVLRR